MENTGTINLTYSEAALIKWIDQALEAGRLYRESPTFTSRGLALAIYGLPGVMHRPNYSEVGALLDRMGVTLIILNSRRRTAELDADLPECRALAQQELTRVRDSFSGSRATF